MVQEELAAYGEKGEVAQNPQSMKRKPRIESHFTTWLDETLERGVKQDRQGVLESMTLNLLLARKIRKPRTRMYAATEYHTRGSPIK